LVINLQTTKALSLTVPITPLGRADGVLETIPSAAARETGYVSDDRRGNALHRTGPDIADGEHTTHARLQRPTCAMRSCEVVKHGYACQHGDRPRAARPATGRAGCPSPRPTPAPRPAIPK